MGTNNPNLPNNVLSDEEAIIYLATMVAALKAQTYTAQTGAGPFTLTGAQMVGGVCEFSGGAAVTVNTATAANIISAMQALDANAGVGSTAQFALLNDNSGTMTFTANTGVSIVGTGGASLLTTVYRRYQIKILTLTTVSLTVVG